MLSRLSIPYTDQLDKGADVQDLLLDRHPCQHLQSCGLEPLAG